MSRLVEHHLAGAGDLEGDRTAEAAILDAAGERRPFGREIGNGLFNVVTHERDLVVLGSPLGRVDSELRRTGPEDEPAVVRIDVRPAEHVAEEGPCGVGIIARGQAYGDR